MSWNDPAAQIVLPLAAGWLFILGGVVGSFLNVVAWRVPAGMSVLWPGSHCPKCQTPIRWYDNLPILGWLKLRGRCRACHAAISPRYPLVEAVAACLFLAIGGAEFVASGWNLPERVLVLPDGVITPLRGAPELAAITAYHLVLISTLLAAALIEFDRKPVPLKVFVPALVVGIVGPVLLGEFLRPVPGGLRFWPALTDGLLGAAAGGAVSAGDAWARRRWGGPMAAVCVGLYLGWQACAAILLVSAALVVASRLWRRVPLSIAVAVVTPAWLLSWSWLVAKLPMLALG